MKTYIQFIIIGLFVTLVNAKTPFELRIQKVNCITYNQTVVSIVKCAVKAKNRTTTYINVGVNITEKIDEFMLNGQLMKKNHVNYKPFLVNVTEDLCEYFGKNRGGVYLRLVAKIYQPYSNFKHPCPYYGYHYIEDLPVNEDQLPVIFPYGIYRLDLNFFQQNKPITFVLRIFFDLMERRRS